MKAIRKPFRLDPLFPLEMTYCKRRTARSELPDHFHDLYELVYVHEGQGTFFINNVFYEKKPNELYLIPGNTIHRSFPDNGNPVVSTALFFSPMLLTTAELNSDYAPLTCYDNARRSNQYNIKLSEAQHGQVQAILLGMHEELGSEETGYRHAVQLYLHQLILLINRLPDNRRKHAGGSSIGPEWMLDTLHRIDRDPVHACGLAEFAARAYVTPSHFSRMFKKMTGMTLHEYITAKRIILAKQMLLASGDTIESVAAACGFSSLPMFYQKFKQLTGVTPRDYRISPDATSDRGW